MRINTLVMALAMSLAAASAQAKDLAVVASIKPIHALASAVMAGAGTPTLIVEGNASEHMYALRPSQARALADADLVVWVGPMLESFLARPLSTVDATHVLTLIDLETLTRLKFRVGGPFEPEEEEHEDEHHHDDEHEHEEEGHHHHEAGSYDGHIWLDPTNAIVIAGAIADALAVKDAEHAALYHENAKTLTARLEALDSELASAFTPLKGKPFIVFHDAYQYLEHRYGLTTAGSVTVNPEVPASAKRIAALKDKIVGAGAMCLFAEPQFDPKLINSLKEGTGAHAGVLDPLGADIPAGPEQYFTLMADIRAALTSCLAP